MADFVVNAEDVGQVVLYVAPGFFARLAYEARFPQRERSSLHTVVWGIAASLPLVAVGDGIASLVGVAKAPTDYAYVATLLIPAVLIGYFVALLRAWRLIRRMLGWLGLRHQPEGSLYAQTMLALSSDAVVTLELLDGRRLSGTPRAGPSLAEDDVDELVLGHPAWLKPDGSWDEESSGEAVLIPLTQISNVSFSEDPMVL